MCVSVASWFLSPVLSGVISICLFLIVRTLVLRRPEPLEPGLRSLPFFYGFTILINVFSVVHDGPSREYWRRRGGMVTGQRVGCLYTEGQRVGCTLGWTAVCRLGELRCKKCGFPLSVSMRMPRTWLCVDG